LVSVAPVFTALAAHWLTPDEKLSGKLMSFTINRSAGVFFHADFLPNQPLSGLAIANLLLLSVLSSALGYVFWSLPLFGKKRSINATQQNCN
jgi:drug/metabolite transporter (DMT)-like permease